MGRWEGAFGILILSAADLPNYKAGGRAKMIFRTSSVTGITYRRWVTPAR